MIYTINELEHKVFEKPYAVYDIFKDFFGEENVDLQFEDSRLSNLIYGPKYLCPSNVAFENLETTDLTDEELAESIELGHRWRPFIFVYWPTVKVTNEYNRSVIIQDLYAKIALTIEGTIPYESRGFLLNRATYTKDQWVSSYLHSHIPRIPKDNLKAFQLPCLGTGPIARTITTLKMDNDAMMWMLFCQELAMYVTVESIEGIPYNRMENIGKADEVSNYSGYNVVIDRLYGNRLATITKATVLSDFTKYYLQHGHLVIDYKDGYYTSGMSYYDYILDISSCFIDYFNYNLREYASNSPDFYTIGILKTVFVKDHKFYKFSRHDDTAAIGSYIGQTVCTFKGKEIKLTIIDSGESEMQETTLLNNCIALTVLESILKIINYHYGNNRNQEGNSESSSSSEGIYYI